MGSVERNISAYGSVLMLVRLRKIVEKLYFSVSRGWGTLLYPPSSNFCTWSRFVIRWGARSRGVETQFSARTRGTHTPFCFTFSNDTTRSDSDPGNALERWFGVKEGGNTKGTFADGGLCAPMLACWGPCIESPCDTLTPGGNWGCTVLLGGGETLGAVAGA